MLTEEKEESNNDLNNNNVVDYRCFVSATEGNFIGKLMLPEAKAKKCFESLGSLITLCRTAEQGI